MSRRFVAVEADNNDTHDSVISRCHEKREMVSRKRSRGRRRRRRMRRTWQPKEGCTYTPYAWLKKRERDTLIYYYIRTMPCLITLLLEIFPRWWTVSILDIVNWPTTVIIVSKVMPHHSTAAIEKTTCACKSISKNVEELEKKKSLWNMRVPDQC